MREKNKEGKLERGRELNEKRKRERERDKLKVGDGENVQKGEEENEEAWGSSHDLRCR